MRSGWQHHALCTGKYHFIIPVRATQEAALSHGNIPALVEIWMQGDCRKPLRLPQHLAEDAGSPYIAPVSIFDSTSHLLHGVLHANGFGHLLRINGLEGGSEHVTGKAYCLPVCLLCLVCPPGSALARDAASAYILLSHRMLYCKHAAY